MWSLATHSISSTGQDVIDQCKEQAWNKELYSFIISKRTLSTWPSGVFVEPFYTQKAIVIMKSRNMHGSKFMSNILNCCEPYIIIVFFFSWNAMLFYPSALSLESKYKYSI